mmetsp:Transcript_56796/g.151555  ORF Transcript_56796/g.151555 Transcript_56796/m.151555 type:complete len:339 (+) Transcript_56796:65-1081(+)
MVICEAKLLNPLAIRFSQKHVSPEFQENGLVEAVVPKIQFFALEDGHNADLHAFPPFRPIEVIRWSPQETRIDQPVAAADTVVRYGKERWFTLDNRRLLALQMAALREWPKACVCIVIVLSELPAIRTARKFDTENEGAGVDIQSEGVVRSHWNWKVEAKAITDKLSPVPRKSQINKLLRQIRSDGKSFELPAAATESKRNGTVKFFNDEKGFGFIEPEDKSLDLFVHRHGIVANAIQAGDSVTFKIAYDYRANKYMAEDVVGGTGPPVSKGKGGGRREADEESWQSWYQSKLKQEWGIDQSWDSKDKDGWKGNSWQWHNDSHWERKDGEWHEKKWES